MKNKVMITMILMTMCFSTSIETVSALSTVNLTERTKKRNISVLTEEKSNYIDSSNELGEEKEADIEIQDVNEKEINNYPETVKVENLRIEVSGRGNPSNVLKQEQRNFNHSSFETTGVYLPRGEELVIYVEGEEDPKDLSVVIGLYGEYDTELFDLEEANQGMQKSPLVKGENRVSRPSGEGLVYLENREDYGSISVIIDGGLRIPRFKSGETTKESFIEQVEMYSNYVPFFELEGDNTLSAFQLDQLKYLPYKNQGHLEMIVDYWDEVIVGTNEHYGFINEAGGVAKKNTNQRVYIANPTTGAGYAYATSGYISFQVDTGASKELLQALPTEYQWGFWHEVGHTYQNKYYTFDEDHIEVTVNLSANAMNQNFLSNDRTEGYKNEILSYLNQPIENRVYSELTDHFVRLSMFWTLQRIFGETFYQKVNQFYRTMDSSKLPITEDEKYQMFVKATSEVTQRNLIPYFREWGFSINDETYEYCSKFVQLEKEIWKDIAGFDERFELLDILGKYTVPKVEPYLIDTPIFTEKEKILLEGLISVPINSETSVINTSYADIGENMGAFIVMNEEGVRNKSTITNVTGGDAIRFFGNSSGIQVIAPNPDTKQFQVVGTSGKFHGSWGASLYASLKLYSSEGELKKESLINGDEDSNRIQTDFQHQSYEIGDIIEIYHAESHNRLSRYKDNELLERDGNRKYWYKMTEKGWEEIDANPTATFIEGQSYTLTSVIKAEDLVKDVKGLYPNSELSIKFESDPVLMDVGEKEVTIIVEDSLAGQLKLQGTIDVVGGDAIRFFGNSSGIQVIAPNPDTKQFQVVGASGNFHQSWGANLYASLKLYSSEGELKKESLINGDDDSNRIQTDFQHQSYEIGDIIEIYHAESHNRLSRYKENELLERDENRKYWYKMTEKGWEEIDANPTATFIEGQSYTLTSVIKAEDLVKDVKGLHPNSELSIKFESDPVLMDVGEKEVTIIVEDSLAGQLKLQGTIDVVGGDAIRFFGNSSGIQVIAPNPDTKQFQVVGTSGKFHGSWGASLYASLKLYSSEGELKKESLINGDDDSNRIQTDFQHQSYEIGDIIEIYHAESHNRLSRYKDNELLERDSSQYYLYKMTNKGWEDISIHSDFEFRFDGDEENKTATVVKYNGTKTDIEIPETVIKFSEGNFKEIMVVAIGDYAFSNANFTSVSIPGSVKVIGKEAFRRIGTLTVVHLNEGLEEIGISAFDNTSVSEMILPKSLKKIAEGAFWAANLSEIIINENVEEIGNNAFRSNGTINSVTVHSNKIKYGETIFGNSQVEMIYASREKLETIKGQLTSAVMNNMNDNNTRLRAIEDYKFDDKLLNINEKEQLSIEVTNEYRFDPMNALRWTLDTPEQLIKWYKDNELIASGLGVSTFTINEISRSDAGIYHAERNERILSSIYVTVNHEAFIIPPLDPTNPESIEVQEGALNANAGELSILYVSSLLFESKERKNSEQVIYGTTKENNTPIIALQDFREDKERVGWELYLRQTNDFNEGATLQMEPYIHEYFKDTLKVTPAFDNLTINTESQKFAKTTVQNPPSGVVTMGMSHPDKNGISLTIPKGAGLGSYKTNLVWELVSSP